MAIGVALAPQRRVYAAFFFYAFALGSIYPRLGDIQLAMGIGEGALGAALMGIALGAQVALMTAGPYLERFGYRRVLLASIPAIAAVEIVAALSTGPVMLFALLFVVGLGAGAVEIIINLEADRTEHLLGRRVMNRSHAFWSFGFFGAGMLGAVAKQAGLSPGLHLLIMALIAGSATFVFLGQFQPAPPRTSAEGAAKRFVWPNAGILLLVGFTLSAMLLEGANTDWSVIYMRDVFATAPFINGLAFAIGAFSQATARFFADGIIEKYGPVAVGRVLVATLGVGTSLVTFAPIPGIALAGFALIGIGASAIFPMAMSAAAQRTDRPAAANVAALAQLSFLTFLVAPPMLGFVAEHFGIRTAFATGIPFALFSLFTAHVLRPGKSAGSASGTAHVR